MTPWSGVVGTQLVGQGGGAIQFCFPLNAKHIAHPAQARIIFKDEFAGRGIRTVNHLFNFYDLWEVPKPLFFIFFSLA